MCVFVYVCMYVTFAIRNADLYDKKYIIMEMDLINTMSPLRKFTI